MLTTPVSETPQTPRARTPKATQPIRLLASLVRNTGKSSTSTRAWMATTPRGTAIIGTERTSSVHLPATMLTISAKVKRQAMAQPWHTGRWWWFKTSYQRMDGRLLSSTNCSGNPHRLEALSTPILGATPPRLTPSAQDGLMPTQKPCPGR